MCLHRTWKDLKRKDVTKDHFMLISRCKKCQIERRVDYYWEPSDRSKLRRHETYLNPLPSMYIQGSVKRIEDQGVSREMEGAIKSFVDEDKK